MMWIIRVKIIVLITELEPNCEQRIHIPRLSN